MYSLGTGSPGEEVLPRNGPGVSGRRGFPRGSVSQREVLLLKDGRLETGQGCRQAASAGVVVPSGLLILGSYGAGQMIHIYIFSNNW